MSRDRRSPKDQLLHALQLLAIELWRLTRLTGNLVTLKIRLARLELALDDASTASFQILVGGLPMEVTAISQRVGADPQFVQVIPRKAPKPGESVGEVDTSVEDVQVSLGDEGFHELVPYEVEGELPNPLKFGIRAIATDPGDVSHVTPVTVSFDSDTSEEGGVPNVQRVSVTLLCTATASNATTATIETIPAPGAPPAEE